MRSLRSRASTARRIAAPAKACLTCDIGGTRIKLGLVRDARLLARTEIPAAADRGLASALPRIAREARRLCQQSKVQLGELAGFGLAFPGLVDPHTDRILSTPAGKFDDAKEIDIATWAQRELGLIARICNDANAAMAGEWHFGAARRFGSVVMMTLGTGIGTSAIIEGVPLRGAHGQAGCLGGHWTIDVAGRRCPCGNIGCAETEASTWALPAQARAHPLYPSSRLAFERTLDFAAVFRHAATGDRVAQDLRHRALHVWSATLVSLIHAYDPQCAIIGGGIIRAGPALLTQLRRHVRRHAWTPWGQVSVRAAQLGNDAGLLGMSQLLESFCDTRTQARGKSSRGGKFADLSS